MALDVNRLQLWTNSIWKEAQLSALRQTARDKNLQDNTKKTGHVPNMVV